MGEHGTLRSEVTVRSLASTSVGSLKEIKRTKDGIRVYKREVPGSALLAFKGEGTVDAPIEKVATIIYDTTRATEWIADLKESRILRWTGEDPERDQLVLGRGQLRE